MREQGQRQPDRLPKEWDELEVKRLELLSRHDPEGRVYFEDEPWHEEFARVEEKQQELLLAVEACEEAEMESEREFDNYPSVLDGEIRVPGDFAWDHWERWAVGDGIDEKLAALGREVIREAYQHNWPEELKAECGWEDSGGAMLELAKSDPERARIRWRYLLDSDGDFWWK